MAASFVDMNWFINVLDISSLAREPYFYDDTVVYRAAFFSLYFLATLPPLILSLVRLTKESISVMYAMCVLILCHAVMLYDSVWPLGHAEEMDAVSTLITGEVWPGLIDVFMIMVVIKAWQQLKLSLPHQ